MSHKQTPKHLTNKPLSSSRTVCPKVLRDGRFEDEELAMSPKYDTSVMNSVKQQHYSCARTLATSRR
jgi:hypothetical protein